MFGVREPMNVVRFPADQNRQKTPNAWQANQPLNRGILGGELVDQSIGRCNLDFDAVMEFAVCLEKMRIGTWQGDPIKPGPAFPGINSFVLWKFDGMLGKQGTYPVSEHRAQLNKEHSLPENTPERTDLSRRRMRCRNQICAQKMGQHFGIDAIVGESGQTRWL